MRNIACLGNYKYRWGIMCDGLEQGEGLPWHEAESVGRNRYWRALYTRVRNLNLILLQGTSEELKVEKV